MVIIFMIILIEKKKLSSLCEKMILDGVKKEMNQNIEEKIKLHKIKCEKLNKMINESSINQREIDIKIENFNKKQQKLKENRRKIQERMNKFKIKNEEYNRRQEQINKQIENFNKKVKSFNEGNKNVNVDENEEKLLKKNR